MAELDPTKTVSLQELMISTLAMVESTTKLLIAKGIITDAEFKEQLLKERATYQALLKATEQ